MFTLNVEMYGIPQKITQQYKTSVNLEDEAGLKDVVQALKRKIPALEGPVISRGQDRLTEEYSFIINGRSLPGDSNIKIRPDDRIVLVLLATGG
ncbi:MAG: MoaD/ThiS family protein [Dehalococcoidales bacterium]|nr:MoaD/ThiS family protein [Dehalococcoidales bacterium]